MKNISILIIVALIEAKSYSQLNIVDYGNFEAAKTDNCSIGGNGYCPWQPYQDQKDYWSNFYGWTYPKNLPTLGPVGSPDILCEEKTIVLARSGKRVGHTINREFLINKMNNKTQNNIIYYIEFYVKAVTPFIENSGMKFFINQPWQDGLGTLKKSYGNASGWNVVDVQIPLDVEFNIDNWRKVSRYFATNNNYEYFAFGSFIDENKTQQLWVDDISVIALNSTACPPYWKFQNTEFNTDMLFQASDYITIGENHDNTQPVGPVYFRTGSKTIIKAANTINILPGTVYEPNSFVHMVIEPCGNGPCPPAVVNNSIYTVCNTNPLTFVQPNTTGVFYSWSPADYLDNPNSSSPVFTPPSNYVGVIEYTVTATNICGNSQTATVKVKVDTDPNPSPWFAIVNPTQPPYYDAYHFSVDINVNPHTEWVKFEVLKKGTNNVLKFALFERDINFTCCNLTLSTQVFLPTVFACNEYDIRISTKNFCYTNEYVQTYNWNKNYPFNLTTFPNVFSPPNPPNEALYITADGVTMYNIHVFTSWGQLIHNKVSVVNNSPFLVWDGKCSLGPCNGNYVLTGSYQVALKLYGCNGLEYDDAQWVLVFNDNGRIGIFENDSTVELSLTQEVNYKIFPNPSSGTIDVFFVDNDETDRMVTIIDFTGKAVYEKRIIEKTTSLDISALADGMYFIILKEGKEVHKEKIILSK
ncbi:MAG: T9SS type A sorting domain-containing protein [Vicingaceae bacterium]|nr:MAG: T9SS type A sorting domain-containing protein [Vicingaceae bacterium]